MTVGKYELKPGQWVIFGHAKELLSKELEGPFKVIVRNDNRDDICRYILKNEEGRQVDYCPKKLMIGLKTLPNDYNVKIVSEEKKANLEKKLEELKSKIFESK